MKKISVSFLNSLNIPRDLKILDNTDCDFIHVDVMDGKFVSNKSLPWSEMRHIYKYTNKRLDVHLMVEQPLYYIEKFANLNTEYITIHLEIDKDIMELIDLVHSYSIKVGISIKPNTDISRLVPYLPYVDLVLLMSVEPGMGGQEFLENAEDRLQELRDLIDTYKFNNIIEVDGGINDKTVNKCYNSDILVSGSYVINSNNFQESIDSLRGK